MAEVTYGGIVSALSSDTTGNLNVTGTDLYVVSLPVPIGDYDNGSGNAPYAPSAVDFDGQALSSIYNPENFYGDPGNYITFAPSVWGKVLGAANAAFTESGAGYDYNLFDGLYFTGVDQTTPWAVTPTLFTGNQDSPTQEVSNTFTTTAGDMVVGVVFFADGNYAGETVTLGSGLTPLYAGDPGGYGGCYVVVFYGPAAGSSLNASATVTNSGYSNIYMVAGVLAATSGGGGRAALAGSSALNASSSSKASIAGQTTLSAVSAGGGSATIIQTAGPFYTGGALSLPCSIEGVTAGNYLVVCIGNAAFGTVVSSVTDNSDDNSYVLIGQDSDGGANAAIACSAIVVGGDLTVTVNLSASTNCTVYLYEISGLTGVDSKNASADASSATHSSGNVSTSNANCFLIGCGHSTGTGNTSTITSSGWSTDLNYTGNSGSGYPQLLTGHDAVSETGTYAFDWSQASSSTNSASVIVAFVATGGGGVNVGTFSGESSLDAQSASETVISGASVLSGHSAQESSIAGQAFLQAQAASKTSVTGQSTVKGRAGASGAVLGRSALIAEAASKGGVTGETALNASSGARAKLSGETALKAQAGAEAALAGETALNASSSSKASIAGQTTLSAVSAPTGYTGSVTGEAVLSARTVSQASIAGETRLTAQAASEASVGGESKVKAQAGSSITIEGHADLSAYTASGASIAGRSVLGAVSVQPATSPIAGRSVLSAVSLLVRPPIGGGTSRKRRNKVIVLNGVRYRVPVDRVDEFWARMSPPRPAASIPASLIPDDRPFDLTGRLHDLEQLFTASKATSPHPVSIPKQIVPPLKAKRRKTPLQEEQEMVDMLIYLISMQ